MAYQFIRDITHRQGEGSSKKLWYNGACLAATICLFWITFKLPTTEGMEDWAYIWLFAIYLVTVGGFDVILEMMRLAIQWRGGKDTTTTTNTMTEVKNVSS